MSDIIESDAIQLNTIQSMYELACAAPSDIHEHLPVIHEYCLKCAHVTEFGVRDVVSTWAMLHAKPMKCISYDVHESDKVAAAAMIVAREHVHWQFIKADTLSITMEQTDLLFIDTLHTYDQLIKELELHHDKVNKYIMMHDTSFHGDTGENGRAGLWQAIQEFLQKHAQWQLVERRTNNNGLTVLGRK